MMHTLSSGTDPLPRRRRRLGLAALLALGLVAAACGGGDDGGSTAGNGGSSNEPVEVPDEVAETIRIGGVYAPTVDPLSRIGGSANHAFGDPLIMIRPGEDPQPWLVEEWTEESNTTATFKLREGVLFHDGTELKASDVKFSIDTILARGSGPASNLAVVDSVEVLSDYEFRVTTKAPDPLLIRRMYLVFPVPEADYDPDTYARVPVATGPFKVVSNDTTAQLIKAERHEDYWNGEVASPKAEFPGFSDPKALQSALESGQLDASALVTSAAGTLDRSRLNTETPRMGSASVLAINTTKPGLDDPRVRQAMNYAIDREAIIENVLFGGGFDMEGQLADADTVGYVEDWENPYPYDPDKARDLLAEAGVDDLSVTIEATADQGSVMEAVAGYLSEVGIDATYRVIDNAQWLDGFVKGSPTDLFDKRVNFSPLYDVDIVNNWMNFPNFPMEGGFQAWPDPTWAEMLAESRALTGDERQAKLDEMAHYLAEQAPVLFLYHQTYTYAWYDDLKNFDPSTGFFIELQDVFKEA